MSRYVVIGAGASGVALIERLRNAGEEVFAVDNDPAALTALNLGIHVAVGGADTRTVVLDQKHTILLNDFEAERHASDPLVVFLTVPNYGTQSEEGRTQALQAALRMAGSAGIVFDLTNGYKEPITTNDAVLGVINSPTTLAIMGRERRLNYVSGDKFNIALGNDSPSILKLAVDYAAGRTRRADIGIDMSKPQMQVVFNKLAEIISMGPLALFGTKFGDAPDENSPTGIITKDLLREMDMLATSLKGAGIIQKDFGDFDDFYTKQQAVLKAKAGSPGSLRMMLEANPPKRTEAAFYLDLAMLAEKYGAPNHTLAATYALIQTLEDEVHVGENISDLRKNFVIEGPDILANFIQHAKVLPIRSGKVGTAVDYVLRYSL